MIAGIGIDLVEVERVKASHEKLGELFLKRILLPDEISYCLSHKEPAPHIAARFAAKEAVSKAFGTGIGSQLSWLDMEVCRRESGEPYVRLSGAGAELLVRRGGGKIHLSLSHTAQHATAMAVLETI
jgi:holo-[acyl-carrier protein] synthase